MLKITFLKMKNINFMKYIFPIAMIITIISCHSNQYESAHTAEKFKKLAIDAGVFHRIEFDGVTDFKNDINWDEITDEDWENWKNFVEFMRVGLEDEARYTRENEFAKSLHSQYTEESKGKSRDEKLEIYRKYNKKYPKYFKIWDDPVD